jgi:hypothetical protein
MANNNVVQKELQLSEEEERIHEPRMVRRELLNCDTDKWPLDLKKNAICKLKIDIEPELWNELYEIAQTLEYKNVHKVLNICFWPECKATDKLKKKFKIFEKDIDKYVVLRNQPYEFVYPHRDLVRETSIYLPLGPHGEDYAPLEIYHRGMEYGLPENNTPIVYAWNTKCTHAVFNKSQPRFNIQASINLPYKKVFKKYNDVFDV